MGSCYFRLCLSIFPPPGRQSCPDTVRTPLTPRLLLGLRKLVFILNDFPRSYNFHWFFFFFLYARPRACVQDAVPPPFHLCAVFIPLRGGNSISLNVRRLTPLRTPAFLQCTGFVRLKILEKEPSINPGGPACFFEAPKVASPSPLPVGSIALRPGPNAASTLSQQFFGRWSQQMSVVCISTRYHVCPTGPILQRPGPH